MTGKLTKNSATRVQCSERADCTRANLTGVYLNDAQLDDCVFVDATIRDVVWDTLLSDYLRLHQPCIPADAGAPSLR